MRIQDLNGKKICILGFGREGRAMAAALERFAPDASVTIADKSPTIDVPKTYASQLGDSWAKDLNRFDAVIKSPGIPPKELSSFHLPLSTSSTQIFLDTIAKTGATVVGVTGSKGKSTTSSLIYEILKRDGRKVFLVGNIGEPAIAHIADADSNTIFVHELSSYQLMELTSSPHIAVVTSFFPEHLDYHGSLAEYLGAKKRIARFQKAGDVVIFHSASPEAKQIADESIGVKTHFSHEDSPVRLDEIKLKGEHNLGNIAAALKVARYFGVDKDVAIAAIKAFKGLPHRLESVAKKDGTEWINDSISTTPESAVAALDALGDEVHTIIVGGQDRGYDFTPLAKRIKDSGVKTVILLPDSGATIRKAIEKAGAKVTFIDAKTMQDAVKAAKSTGASIALLSPASPSYGHFKNFEDRGEQFKQAIG